MSKLPVLEPPEYEKATLKPPLVIAFPWVSFIDKVTREELPPDVTDADATLNVERDVEKLLASTWRVGAFEFSGWSLMVARIRLALPAIVPVNSLE